MGPVPPEVVAKMRTIERQRVEHEARHGQVRPIISADFKGYRLVAVGNQLHWAKEEALKVFPDFLNQYLHSALGKAWGQQQVALKLEEQHPVVQWRTIWSTRAQTQERSAEGLFTADTGAALAWHRLAYDLYLLQHHDELQKRLVRRLRDPVAFQGARLEIVAAASMLPAAYELEFENDKLPGKHAEFVATHTRSGHRLAVEAKSRHRPGVLGQKGGRVEPALADINSLLRAAVAKDPADPLLVFIELNLPILLQTGQLPSEALLHELQAAWKEVQACDWPKGFPAIGVIFYNDAAPWFLDSMPAESAEVFVLAMRAEKHRHDFDETTLLPMIVQAGHERLTIPHEFPKQLKK